MVLATRRRLLGTLGTAAVAAGAGCAGGALAGLRSHVHRRDAPVDDPDGPWPTLGADPGRTSSVVDGAPPSADAAPPPADARARAVTSVGLIARSQPVVGDGVAYVVGEGREGAQGALYAVR